MAPEIARTDCTIMDNGTLVIEASTARIPPGCWPVYVRMTGMNYQPLVRRVNDTPLLRLVKPIMEGDEYAYCVYVGAVELHILND